MHCTTSVYATEYRPPKRVYKMATAALLITDDVMSKPRITTNVEPDTEISCYFFKCKV